MQVESIYLTKLQREELFGLDRVCFARIKAVRLPGTEHMDHAYQQKR